MPSTYVFFGTNPLSANFSYVNGFSSTPTISKQYVIREYAATNIQTNNFEIDVYNGTSSISDLKIVVFVNNKLKLLDIDYTIDRTFDNAVIIFNNNLLVDDVIKIKTDSKAIKNSNGYYEFPYNLERNPLNDDVSQFTLGEVIDHVDSMLEDISGYNGIYFLHISINHSFSSFTSNPIFLGASN